MLQPPDALRRELSSRLALTYGAEVQDVHLTKSGRSGLAAVAAALRESEGRREVVIVPANVCNVVPDAFAWAGFSVHEYPTSHYGEPDWRAVEELVRGTPSPVLVLCAMFGAHPWQAVEARRLKDWNPNVFTVLDECQSLGISDPRLSSDVGAIVTSFNNKALPGVMGGAVVSRSIDLDPVLGRVGGPRRRRTALSIVAMTLARAVRGVIRPKPRQARPASSTFAPFDYSSAARLHFDYVPDRIYKLSAAAAVAALRVRHAFDRAREERGLAVAGMPGVALSPSSTVPVHVPVASPVQAATIDNVLWKRPYGRSKTEPAAHSAVWSIRTNAFGWRYEASSPLPAVCQLTSRHKLDDNRILHLMALTAKDAGYRSIVVGPAATSRAVHGVELRARPSLPEGASTPALMRWWWGFVGALESSARVVHFHDPDLLPVALILRLLGRRVIYDIHDDYQASILTRLRRWPVLARVAGSGPSSRAWRVAFGARSSCSPRAP